MSVFCATQGSADFTPQAGSNAHIPGAMRLTLEVLLFQFPVYSGTNREATCTTELPEQVNGLTLSEFTQGDLKKPIHLPVVAYQVI